MEKKYALKVMKYGQREERAQLCRTQANLRRLIALIGLKAKLIHMITSSKKCLISTSDFVKTGNSPPGVTCYLDLPI